MLKLFESLKLAEWIVPQNGTVAKDVESHAGWTR